MSYLITHFYEDGTKEQYDAVVEAVHPPGGLPAGQVYHAAGPTGGGWLISAVWDSKDACDTFVTETLSPALPALEGGLAGPPQERAAEVDTPLTA
jgi:hypothetical protein